MAVFWYALAATAVLTVIVLTPLLRRWTRDDKALSMPAGSPEAKRTRVRL